MDLPPRFWNISNATRVSLSLTPSCKVIRWDNGLGLRKFPIPVRWQRVGVEVILSDEGTINCQLSNNIRFSRWRHIVGTPISRSGCDTRKLPALDRTPPYQISLCSVGNVWNFGLVTNTGLTPLICNFALMWPPLISPLKSLERFPCRIGVSCARLT